MPINCNEVCKLMWPFAKYGHSFNELFCAVTAFVRSSASILQRSPAHYWQMQKPYISRLNCLVTAFVVRCVCYTVWSMFFSA